MFMFLNALEEKVVWAKKTWTTLRSKKFQKELTLTEDVLKTIVHLFTIFFLSSLVALLSKESDCSTRRLRFNSWIRKIPWRRWAFAPPYSWASPGGWMIKSLPLTNVGDLSAVPGFDKILWRGAW